MAEKDDTGKHKAIIKNQEHIQANQKKILKNQKKILAK